MEQHLQSILDLITADASLSEVEKTNIISRLKEADKKMSIDASRIERAESLKKTMSVLLEKTTEELEHERKSLEDKNRELEIESSLERVRTVAMSMRDAADLLKICQILFEELTALGFAELRNAMINIVDDEKGSFLNYDFHSDGGGNITHFQYNSHPVIKRQVEMTRSASDAFFEHILKGDDLEDFKAFRVRNGEPPDPKLENISALYYYFYSIGVGSVGISAFSSLAEEKRDMLKRFRNVFDLAYRRYTDIRLAEAQARQAQIELALERVRARTMAMQRSQELAETAFILFQQFKELGENPDQATIGIINEQEWVIEYWVTMYGSQINKVFKFSIDEPHVTNRIYKAWKANEKSMVIDLSGKELYEFTTYRASMGGAAFNPDEQRRVINVAFFSKGLINVQSSQERSAESVRLLERFAAVFDGTYTRFLDLKNAERQARESQIELALERVRARTMAMQKSDELKDIIKVVYEQFGQLNILAEHAGFIMDYQANEEMKIWLTDQHFDPSYVTIPYFDSPHWNSFIQAKKTGTDFFATVLDFQEKNKFYRQLFELVPGVTDQAREYYFNCPGLAGSTVLLDNVGLYIENFSGIPYTDEENATLMRFGKVFQQTYTRFLDLQKAEAQAREAKIEAALERTRTQSMIMQHSNELDNTLRVFHQQVLHLGIESAFSFLWLPDEQKDRHIFWAAWAEDDSKTLNSKAVDYPLDRNEPATGQCLLDWKANVPVVAYRVPPEGVEAYFAAWQQLIAGVEQLKPEYFAGGLYYVEAFMKYGCFGVMVKNELPEEHKKILVRFAIEFERTYTRFLDLQKAEDQAREAKIEASLERVRSKTMAMHNSQDIADTIITLFDELLKLGVDRDIRCGVNVFDQAMMGEVWTASFDTNGTTTLTKGRINMNIHPLLAGIYQAWQNKQQHAWQELSGNELKEYFRALTASPEYPFRYKISELPKKQVNNAFFFPEGCLFAFTAEQLSEEAARLFKRFAGVFGLTYRRYLDLQKAEAQARQAQIEVAMEKVRSRSLAMQKPEELMAVAQLLRQEMALLGVEELETSSIYIHHNDSGRTDCWYAIKDDHKLVTGHMDMNLRETWVGRQMLEFYHSDKTQTSIPMKGQNRKEWISYCSAKSDVLDGFYGQEIPERTYHLNKFSNGYMGAAAPGDISPESWELLQRATSVFSFAYTRFSDLQQAGAQAREAQIEAALERVRSRTMGMQKSEELSDVIHLVYEQLLALDFKIYNAGFIMDYKQNDDFNVWSADWRLPFPVKIYIPYFDHPHFNRYKQAKARGLDFDAWRLDREEKNTWFAHLFRHIDVPPELQQAVWDFPGLSMSIAFLRNVALYLTNYQGVPYSEAENATLKRFAAVFEQTYTRFRDLQQAEEQAKESQTQLALERVRARTMAMQKSDELAETSVEVFKQLIGLGIQPNRLFIGIIKDDTGEIELWATEEDGSKISTRFTGHIARNLSVKKMYAGWKAHKKSLTIDMRGKELKEYFRYLSEELKVPFKLGLSQKRRVQSIAYFSQGFIGMAAPEPQPEETINLLERFAGVFNLTYTRFNDLQKAEAQARQAIKQASVDRVRGEIASMRTVGDLERITPLIWNELTILGIPFIRCGVFIADESERVFHTHLSGADGKALASFNLQFDAEGIGQNVLPAWRNKQIATIHWTKQEFAAYTVNLVNQGTVKSQARYITEHPDTSLDLHLLPFLQGMLYVGNTAPLTADQISLVQSLADAFSTAYARYEDFNKLEAAKQQVENTLSDLKLAQTKLIQSEKMASLGELTAGIAHEIQNPLNFVNNFSDVSIELVDEMLEELEKGDKQEVIAISEDLKQNLEKIRHHGKRADGIVKGMLQHSRTSGGDKQYTNINALADEFLRLSYHGLRAKDKSFNAELVTHFDPDLPKINVIGQDIGRVMLNLFNNAFYAVNQKKKTSGADYKPEVSVTTLSENGQVIISVKDNGVGISDAIKDKIMQPFFTTKPTGEGTGLGLSLTYDMVVKGHGGSISVESKEGQGSDFIIKLPMQ